MVDFTPGEVGVNSSTRSAVMADSFCPALRNVKKCDIMSEIKDMEAVST